MRKIDVIIILGGGIDKLGTISKITKERLDIFLKEKNKFSDIPILLSGRWGGLKRDKPKITEAQAMQKYLVTKGINPARIYLEMKSLDTISNAIFSEEIIRKHKNWKHILLVTSDWHIKRALWIFQKVFGDSYYIHLLFTISQERHRKKRKLYEDCLLAITKKILSKARSTKQGMSKVLQEIHPFYSNSKAAKELLRKVVAKRRRLLS
jgi:uncharacterized SAM-binding protein YcdF (DUF218 family)